MQGELRGAAEVIKVIRLVNCLAAAGLSAILYSAMSAKLFLIGVLAVSVFLAGVPLASATVAAYGGFKGSQMKDKADEESEDEAAVTDADAEGEGEELFDSPFASLSSKLPQLGSGTAAVSRGGQASTASPFGTAPAGAAGGKASVDPFADEDEAELDSQLDEDF